MTTTRGSWRRLSTIPPPRSRLAVRRRAGSQLGAAEPSQSDLDIDVRENAVDVPFIADGRQENIHFVCRRAITGSANGDRDVQLLIDIRVVFDARDGGAARVTSRHSVVVLAEIQGRPYPEWRGGRPMTTLCRRGHPWGWRGPSATSATTRRWRGFRRPAHPQRPGRCYGCACAPNPHEHPDVADVADVAGEIAGDYDTWEREALADDSPLRSRLASGRVGSGHRVPCSLSTHGRPRGARHARNVRSHSPARRRCAPDSAGYGPRRPLDMIFEPDTAFLRHVRVEDEGARPNHAAIPPLPRSHTRLRAGGQPGNETMRRPRCGCARPNDLDI